MILSSPITSILVARWTCTRIGRRLPIALGAGNHLCSLSTYEDTGIRIEMKPQRLRIAVTVLKPHAVSWFGVYLKRQFLTASVFFPIAVVMFGWPFLAKPMVERSNGGSKERPSQSRKAVRRVMLQGGLMLSKLWVVSVAAKI